MTSQLLDDCFRPKRYDRWRICIISDLGFWICWSLGICNGMVTTIEISRWQLPFWKPILWLDSKLSRVDSDRQKFHNKYVLEWFTRADYGL